MKATDPELQALMAEGEALGVRSAPSAGTSRNSARATVWRDARRRASSWREWISWAGLDARRGGGVQPPSIVVDYSTRPILRIPQNRLLRERGER
jgi:hypothetical protein